MQHIWPQPPKIDYVIYPAPIVNLNQKRFICQVFLPNPIRNTLISRSYEINPTNLILSLSKYSKNANHSNQRQWLFALFRRVKYLVKSVEKYKYHGIMANSAQLSTRHTFSQKNRTKQWSVLFLFFLLGICGLPMQFSEHCLPWSHDIRIWHRFYKKFTHFSTAFIQYLTAIWDFKLFIAYVRIFHRAFSISSRTHV